MTCPQCEYNRKRAQLWRHEAYKLAGHPLDWEPELAVRREWVPLTDEEREQLWRHAAYKQAGHPLDREPELVARREWVGLTGEERKQFEQWMHPDVLESVERLLKERNHDA